MADSDSFAGLQQHYKVMVDKEGNAFSDTDAAGDALIQQKDLQVQKYQHLKPRSFEQGRKAAEILRQMDDLDEEVIVMRIENFCINKP